MIEKEEGGRGGHGGGEAQRKKKKRKKKKKYKKLKREEKEKKEEKGNGDAQKANPLFPPLSKHDGHKRGGMMEHTNTNTRHQMKVYLALSFLFTRDSRLRAPQEELNEISHHMQKKCERGMLLELAWKTNMRTGRGDGWEQ